MKAATINGVRKVSLWIAIIGVKEVLPEREKFGISIGFREELIILSGGGSSAATMLVLL